MSSRSHSVDDAPLYLAVCVYFMEWKQQLNWTRRTVSSDVQQTIISRAEKSIRLSINHIQIEQIDLWFIESFLSLSIALPNSFLYPHSAIHFRWPQYDWRSAECCQFSQVDGLWLIDREETISYWFNQRSLGCHNCHWLCPSIPLSAALDWAFLFTPFHQNHRSAQVPSIGSAAGQWTQ